MTKNSASPDATAKPCKPDLINTDRKRLDGLIDKLISVAGEIGPSEEGYDIALVAVQLTSDLLKGERAFRGGDAEITSGDLLERCIREHEEDQAAGRARPTPLHVHMRDLEAEAAEATSRRVEIKFAVGKERPFTNVIGELTLDGEILVAKAKLLKALVASPSKPHKIQQLRLRLRELEAKKERQHCGFEAAQDTVRTADPMAKCEQNPEAAAEQALAAADARSGRRPGTVSFEHEGRRVELHGDTDLIGKVIEAVK